MGKNIYSKAKRTKGYASVPVHILFLVTVHRGTDQNIFLQKFFESLCGWGLTKKQLSNL